MGVLEGILSRGNYYIGMGSGEMAFIREQGGEGGRGTAEYDTTGYWEFLGGLDTLTYSKTSIILPANHISLYN